MKFTNFLSGLGRFLTNLAWFLLAVLPFPAIIIFLICLGFEIEIYIASALLIPIILAASSLGINWFLGHICGAEFYNTGYVSEGRSWIDIVRDEPYYKRAIYVNFTIFVLFIFSIFYFIFVISQDTTWGTIGLILSIIGAIVYFMLAMSAIEKSKIKNSEKMEKEEFAEHFKNKEPIKKENVIKTKFNFEKHPEMKEVYLSYKDNKNKAIHLSGNSSQIKEYNQARLKRDDIFEELAILIHNAFVDVKPDLFNKKTNETIKWEELFNVPFEKLTKKQKDLMVRLLDAHPYKFADDKYYN